MSGEAKLFIASPSFTGDYCGQYVESLIATIKDCQSHGIKTLYKTVEGVHWIDIARDILANLFLHSDCTHMLQIDSDLGWDADAARKMIVRDLPIIGGIYPLRADSEIFPVKLDGDEITGLPGGFMLVKREVIEILSKGEKYRCASMQYGAMDVSPIYTREFRSNGYTGEDYAFCARARAAGYSLAIEPRINFSHVGKKAWTGKYMTKEEKQCS